MRLTIILAITAVLFTPAAHAADPAPVARTIVLVRHGHYVPDATDSTPGPGLSPIGVAQAQLVAARLAGMPGRFDTFLASPLTRAHETSRVIAASIGMQPQVVPELAECTPRTRRKEIVEREKPEDMTACAARLDAFFKTHFVPATGSEKRELYVAHGNVIRYLVTRALGVDTEAWLEMSIAHASMTTIRVEPDGKTRIIAVGDSGHIPPNMLTGSVGMSDKSLAVPK